MIRHIRQRKSTKENNTYSSLNYDNDIDNIEDCYNKDEKEVMNVTNNNQIIVIEKLKFNYSNVDTFILSASEMYAMSVLGYIDKLLVNDIIKQEQIKNYVSSSLSTIVSVYLSFQYKPKEIVSVFNKYYSLLNDNIFNIYHTFGIFDISHFIDNLLIPLKDKLKYIPTLKDIYKLTNINCIFICYNFTRAKTVVFTKKTHGNIPIDILIKKCCLIPFIFKKYNDDHEDILIDYTLVNNDEYKYASKICNISNSLLFKIDVNKDENVKYDIKNMNVVQYTKQIIETILLRDNNNYYNTDTNNTVILDINEYNKALLFDDLQKYKELINLYCTGYDQSFDIDKQKYAKYNDNLEDITNIDDNYKGMVVSGGGTNVFILLGCIKYCIDNNVIKLEDIDIYIGTSAGSFLCTMLVLGFNIDDLIDIYVNDISDKFRFDIKNVNIVDRIKEKSLLSNKILIEGYESIFIKYRDGQIPTLLDIKLKYGKEIIYTVFNMTNNKLEYLNYLNSPDLLVTQACAISSCLPLVFNPIEYNKCYYIDGGVKSNYPIEKTHDYLNKQFIGFGITYLSNYSRMNLFEYLYYFLMENARKYQTLKIENSKNCVSHCIKIVYDDNREGESLLIVNRNKINQYINRGYVHMNNKMKTDKKN